MQRMNNLLPISGVHFNEKASILQIYMPQKISLFNILHSGNYQPLQSIEKLLIAKKVAKTLYQIHNLNMGDGMKFAHSHLSSKNIFVNIRDMEVQIGDFGLSTLKKFCKLFHDYSMLSHWSAPEVWECHYQQPNKDSMDDGDDSDLE